MDKTLSNQKTSRVPELEILKFVAIVGMVFVHFYEVADEGHLQLLTDAENTVGWFITFMGGAPAAPAFMFAMGGVRILRAPLRQSI